MCVNKPQLCPPLNPKIMIVKRVVPKNINEEHGSSVVRVLDPRLKGCWFEPYRGHWVVSLSMPLYPLLNTGSTQEDLSQHD